MDTVRERVEDDKSSEKNSELADSDEEESKQKARKIVVPKKSVRKT